MTPTKAQYQRNKELYKARALAYYRTHITEKIEYNKQWRQAHPEKNREYQRDARKRHPEYNERRKQWTHEHPDIVKMWRKNTRRSDEAKKHRLLHQAKLREQNSEKIKIYSRIHHHEEDYPLAEACELCPEEDTRKATHRHHSDYEFPEIYVSCCTMCHQWVHRVPVFYPIVPLVS